MDKDALRQKLKTVRAGIKNRAQKDKLLTKRLEQFLAETFPELKTVFAYVSIGSEVDTRAFIESASKRYELFYPLTAGDGTMLAVKALKFRSLAANRFGNLPSDCVAHSIPDTVPALTVTPLLGFNGDLQRIGYGRGCYDRYFTTVKTIKVGIAYDEQYCAFAPGEYDVPLDYIITPETIWKHDKPSVFQDTTRK